MQLGPGPAAEEAQHGRFENEEREEADRPGFGLITKRNTLLVLQLCKTCSALVIVKRSHAKKVK